MNRISLIRVVRWLNRPLFTLAAIGGGTLIGGRGFAQATHNRYPITPDLVIAAMTARQLPTEAIQIRLAAPITSSSAHSSLQIESVVRTGELGAQLRMACQTTHDCVPFYVAVTWPQSSASLLPDDLNKPPSGNARPALSSRAANAADVVSGSPIMRSGTPATLLIEDQKIHIRLQVICLQDGVAGANIRVATPDHKQSYRAEVLAPNLLKGSF